MQLVNISNWFRLFKYKSEKNVFTFMDNLFVHYRVFILFHDFYCLNYLILSGIQ